MHIQFDAKHPVSKHTAAETSVDLCEVCCVFVDFDLTVTGHEFGCEDSGSGVPAAPFR